MSVAKGWSRAFADPIVLPDGGELITLRDAGNYITALPQTEHDKPHRLTAALELVIAAEQRCGILMLAEISMRQALANGSPETS